MIDWRKIAKKSALLFWINAKVKGFKLKRDLARLSTEYQRKAITSNINYSEDKTVADFKSCLGLKYPNFTPTFSEPLRIFWVGTNRDQDESGFIQALQRLARVTVFYNHKGLYGTWGGDAMSSSSNNIEETRKANDDSLLKQVMKAHAEGGIDVLVGQMWAHRISKEALGKVQSMGIPVINISMDDRLPANWSDNEGLRLGSVGLVEGVDMVLTTSPETCLWYAVERCPALFWPLASSPEVFAPSDDEIRDIDVLFIGNKYGARAEIIQYIKNHGVKVECYGRGWSNGYVNAEQMASLSKRASIILGVGTVGYCPDVYTLKLRDFDALMTGALYMTHRNPDLCRIFKEGEEMECYESPQEAVEKIRYYLDHQVERELIGRVGQKKARAQHNWDVRLDSTFRQLGLLQSNKSHASSAKKYSELKK
tara:strand:+ start:2424 stop:3695 length:1272 start_codon:yes stop_codon:yes gene_type:complete